MDNLTLTEKTIGELLEYNFFIPSYQRGYRWKEQQVEDLLNDIDTFIPKQNEKSNKETWYCLQPVVIKKCDETTKEKNDPQGNWYEVIDGQQRLTSIFLIIHYANKMWIENQKIPKFEYETRKNSSEFLQELKFDDEQDEVIIKDDDNIDFHHIKKAYNKIHNWVKNYKKEHNKEFDKDDFQCKLKSHSKVIWYEVSPEKDSIEIFTRINMGKIPLTNAELIKALFLNSSNFQKCNDYELKLKQLEIASEWDRIEYSLQNEEFWYFINKKENILPTRIEYIFNLMKATKNNENDQYSTFRFFLEKFKTKNQDEIEKNWQEIKRYFQTIEEWFNDRELYHKIGYLIAVGKDIKKLINPESQTKKKFKQFLDDKIAEKVKCDDIKDLEYGNPIISNILLLHNIQTMLANENESSRFPFDRYKKEKWDIEHIHAIATEVKVKEEKQKEWLDKNFIETEKHINEESKDIIEDIRANKKPIEEKDFHKIISYVLGEEVNHIGNLCLLDKRTNRSYKNDSFREKRKKIIGNEKKGTFIPICTKNIFMKYYSEKLINLELWNETDRNSYFKDIEETLKNYYEYEK